MKRFLIGACSLLFILQSVSAQSIADPAYANMQRSMGGIIQNVAAARGFSTSDPRIYSTLYGMGTSAATGAATAGAGLLIAGTAPAWGTILAVAAISGAVSYGVGLGMDSLVKWAFGTPAATPISVTAPAIAAPNNLLILAQGQSISMNTIVSSSINTVFTVVTTSAPNYFTVSYYSTTAYVNPDPAVYVGHTSWTYNSTFYYVWNTATTTSAMPCPAGTTQNGTQCVGTSSGTSTVVNQTLTQAIAALSDAQKATALNDQTMAMMLNYLWKQAASQPGYDGLPYVDTNPVSTGDVDGFMKNNPASYPTVASLTTAIPAGSNGFNPSTTTTGPVVPATSITPPATVNPASSSSQLNLGDDPVIGSPSLETPPDGPTIMAPLTTGLAPYMSFNVVMPRGACPAPTFDFRPVLNKQISTSVVCNLYDSISPKVFSAMTLAWTFLFLLIVLRA